MVRWPRAKDRQRERESKRQTERGRERERERERAASVIRKSLASLENNHGART